MPALIFWKINAYLEAVRIALVLCFSEDTPAPWPIRRFCATYNFKVSVESDSGHFHSFFILFKFLQRGQNCDLGNLLERADGRSRELFAVNQTPLKKLLVKKSQWSFPLLLLHTVELQSEAQQLYSGITKVFWEILMFLCLIFECLIKEYVFCCVKFSFWKIIIICLGMKSKTFPKFLMQKK